MQKCKILIVKRAPTIDDYKYDSGQLWLDELNNEMWICIVSMEEHKKARWFNITQKANQPERSKREDLELLSISTGVQDLHCKHCECCKCFGNPHIVMSNSKMRCSEYV